MTEMMEQPSQREPILREIGKKSVLVVDDDMPLRGMLSAALRQHGFQVLLAGDGREAQRVLTLQRPSIILLDLMMPDVNGWDFLQTLKETGFIGQIPVIVISAHLHVDPQAVLQMGVSALLPKPFNLPELIDLIEHLVP
jgi:DNA-binding response OmpR family regulator